MTETTLTPEELKSVEDTVARRDKLFNAIKEANIKRLKHLGKLIKEKERVDAKNKSEARKKGKAARKARKVNRGRNK